MTKEELLKVGDILYVRETWCKNPNCEEYYFKTRPYGIEPYNLKWKLFPLKRRSK